MQILIAGRGAGFAGLRQREGVRSYIDRRMHFALGRFADRVQRVRVACSDVNGPRGGIDKRCRISVTIPNLEAIVASDVASDVRVAVDRAADRVSRTVARRIARTRSGFAGLVGADRSP